MKGISNMRVEIRKDLLACHRVPAVNVPCRGCGSPNQIDPVAIRWNCSVCRWLHRVDANGESSSVVDIGKASGTLGTRSSQT